MFWQLSCGLPGLWSDIVSSTAMCITHHCQMNFKLYNRVIKKSNNKFTYQCLHNRRTSSILWSIWSVGHFTFTYNQICTKCVNRETIHITMNNLVFMCRMTISGGKNLLNYFVKKHKDRILSYNQGIFALDWRKWWTSQVV